MTRREILMAALTACGLCKAPSAAALVVVRLGNGASDLCMVKGGVEVARVRLTVIAPEIINDVACAEGIREGLKAWGDDLPLFLADGGRVSRIV
jgi:hypothetical protein